MEKIIAKQADYVLMVKGNQETLQAELRQAIAQAFKEEHPGLRQYKTKEKNRNRQETREVAVLPVPKGAPVFARWAGVRTIGVSARSSQCC